MFWGTNFSFEQFQFYWRSVFIFIFCSLPIFSCRSSYSISLPCSDIASHQHDDSDIVVISCVGEVNGSTVVSIRRPFTRVVPKMYNSLLDAPASRSVSCQGLQKFFKGRTGSLEDTAVGFWFKWWDTGVGAVGVISFTFQSVEQFLLRCFVEVVYEWREGDILKIQRKSF